MPKFNEVLGSLTQSITRPIIYDIINQLSNITGIKKDAKIRFPGDGQKMQTSGSNIDEENDKFPLLNTDRYNYIDVKESYDLDAISTTAINGQEYTPIFFDKTLDLFVAPIYATSDIVVSFKHVFTNKSEAGLFLDNIRSKKSAMYDLNIHDITYHYLLPPSILLVIKAVHNKREAYLGYGQSLEEYIISNSTDRLTIVSDLVNKDSRLAVSETQTRIIGLYGFDDLPDKPERDESNGTWIISYDYKFSYEKPLSCFIRYPCLVHNNLLPKEYTTFNSNMKDYKELDTSRSTSFKALSIFESDEGRDLRSGSNYMLRLPDFDDYDIPAVPSKTGSVFIALCQVDQQDKRTLLDLNDLGDVMIDKDILEFIKGTEYTNITELYKSILHLSLYRNNFLVSSGYLECSNAGIVKAKVDLDLRKQYRVRLSIVTDLTMLTKNAIETLKKYPKALVKIIGSINELLKNNPDFINLGDKTSISNSDFDNVYRILTGYGYIPSANNGNNNYIIYDDSLIQRRSHLFKDIDPLLVEQYRNQRISSNNIQLYGIVNVNKT